jgi:uncharacterized OB-fold protein
MGSEEHTMLIPLTDEESSGFWEGVAEGQLRLQACGACGRLRHPPRPMCPWCHSTKRHYRAVSGRGVIWSLVVSHPPLLPAYADVAPYHVVVVSLEEDPSLRLVGNVVPAAAATAVDGELPDLDAHLGDLLPGTLRIGDPVAVVFGRRRTPEGSFMVMPYFVQADDIP